MYTDHENENTSWREPDGMRDPWEANETMSVHPKSVIAGAVGVFVVGCILVGFLGYAISRNPYAKDSTTTTTTRRVISYQRSNGVFIAGEGYVSFDPSLYDSYDEYMSSVEQRMQEESEKEVQAVESKRKENEEKYKKQHKDDWQMLLVLVLVPGFVIALICFFMIKRISRIRELEEEIDRIKEKNDRIEEETHAYETDAASIRKKINEVYKELASLDPFPEVQNAPIRSRTQLSSRWKV